jgi:hypothetical protein
VTNRVQVTTRISLDARRGWDRGCLAGGVTMTALMEAIGLELLEHGVRSDVGHEVVERARQIDLERRSRR